MKKIIALMMIAAMVFTMVACQGGNAEMEISEAKLNDDESQMLELVGNTLPNATLFDYSLNTKGKEGTLSFYELNDDGKWEEINGPFTWACEKDNGRIYIAYDNLLKGMEITVADSLGTFRDQTPAEKDYSDIGSSTSVIKESTSIKYGEPIPLLMMVSSDDEQFSGADITAYGNTKQLLTQKDNDRLFVVLATFSDKHSD